MVEVMTLPSLVMVLTIGAVVTAVWGAEVAPGTPPMPKRVVSPTEVKVEPPLVMIVVKVEVDTGLGVADSPSPPPEAVGTIVVSPTKVVIVLPPETMVEKTDETIGEAVTVAVPAGWVTVAVPAPEGCVATVVAPGLAVTATPASEMVVSGSEANTGGHLRLTAAEVNAEADSLLGVSSIGARLVRTVPDAVGEVGVAAKTGSVTAGAAKGRSQALHALNAVILERS